VASVGKNATTEARRVPSMAVYPKSVNKARKGNFMNLQRGGDGYPGKSSTTVFLGKGGKDGSGETPKNKRTGWGGKPQLSTKRHLP